jgi:hypothetical protein
MTNPLPLFIKKERVGGEALQLCHPFYFGRAIFDYPRSENLEPPKRYKKTCIFWCSKLKNPVLYTLSCSDPTKRVQVMISVHKSMSCGYFCA